MMVFSLYIYIYNVYKMEEIFSRFLHLLYGDISFGKVGDCEEDLKFFESLLAIFVFGKRDKLSTKRCLINNFE